MSKTVIKYLTLAGILTSAVGGLFILAFMFISKPYSDEVVYGYHILNNGGFWQGYMHWMNTMSTLPIKDFLQFLVIGVPSAYLDWNYSVVLGLLLPLMVFAYAVGYLLNKTFGIKLTKTHFSIVGLISIFALMISPIFSSDIFRYLDFSENYEVYFDWKLTNISWLWSPGTMAYLLPIAGYMIFATYLITASNLTERQKYLYIILFGFLVGLNNANGALIVAAIAGYYMLYGLKVKTNTNLSWKHIIIFLMVIGFNLAAATLYRGNIARLQSSDYLVEGYTDTFIEGTMKDLYMFAFPTAFLLPISLGIVIYLFLSQLYNLDKKIKLALPLFLITSGVIAILVNNIIAIRLYKSMWHQLSPQIILITGGLILGLYLAQQIANKKVSYRIITAFAAVLLISISITQTINLGTYVIERSDKWWNQYSTHINCGDMRYFWNPELYVGLEKYRDVPKLTEEAYQWKTCDSSNMFP
jgi:hypothetical protein